jgi:4-hydroxybenzoate polyprenyltransferase
MPSWLDKSSDEGDLRNYINSYYFAVVTITTVGYGDITGVSMREKIFIIFMQFVCCGNYGYALNQIGCLIQDYSRKRKEFRKKMQVLNKYLKDREVP